MDLSWPNVNGESGYEIDVADVGNGGGYVDLVTVGANVTSYSDSNVIPFAQLAYRIRALGSGGCNSDWVEASVTLTPPDSALKFDGIDDYGEADGSAAITALSVTGNLTVEAWIVRYDENVADVIVSKHTADTAEGGYTLATTSTNKLSFTVFDGNSSATATITSDDTLPFKQWVHVVGSYANAPSQNGAIAVWVNGNRKIATGVGKDINGAATGSPLQVGRTRRSIPGAIIGAKYFRGKIDEIRISSKVVYATNFTITSAHKNLQVDMDGSTKGLWKMNSDGNTTALDSSGTPPTENRYPATLYNGVLWRAGVTTGYYDKVEGRRTSRRTARRAQRAEWDETWQDGAERDKLRTTSWTQTFTYDQWGNMTASGDETVPVALNASKNQISTVNSVSVTYDNAGNMTYQKVNTLNHNYSYDANNRMWKAEVGTGPVVTKYVYDGLGRRVKKIEPSLTTSFIYNATGELVAEFEGSTRKKEYVYGPSGLLAVVQNPGGSETLEYTTADHLGTPRVITTASGSVQTRHDYFPFGGEIPAGMTYGRDSSNGYPSPSDNVRQKFTAKERDAETGLDFFDARYYSSALARFTSVDPVIIAGNRLLDPQQLNLFQYARNNPLRWSDPSGETIVENIAPEYSDDYEKWKTAFLATDEGQCLWDQFHNDKNFTLTITVDKTRGNGARTRDFSTNSSGELTGATIALGPNLGQQVPPENMGYDVMSSLTESDRSSVTGGTRIGDLSRAVDKFAHEFGHVIDAKQRTQLYVLMEEYSNCTRGVPMDQIRADPEYQRMRQRMPGEWNSVVADMDRTAERATIPVLKQHFGNNMPKRVKKAIQDYEKAHP